jgi:hypothetical protein
MEYYWLILNRSFVVYSYLEGLYGWKFSGPISARTPLFFRPFEHMTHDPHLDPASEGNQNGEAVRNAVMSGTAISPTAD